MGGEKAVGGIEDHREDSADGRGDEADYTWRHIGVCGTGKRGIGVLKVGSGIKVEYARIPSSPGRPTGAGPGGPRESKDECDSYHETTEEDHV